jgi:two-component sensor histidine kinase
VKGDINIEIKIPVLHIAGILLFSFKVFAQNDSLVFHPVSNQVLQNCEIRNIAAAKDGKLWLSTNKGLASFDGNDVHFFGHKQSDISSMWTNSISFLEPLSDNKGNYYVVTISGPTYYFDTKTGNTIPLENAISPSRSLVPKPFSDILIASDSSLWFAPYNSGFLHYNKNSRKVTTYTLLSDSNKIHNAVYSIKKDKNIPGLLWLATNNGIYSFEMRSERLRRNFKQADRKGNEDNDLEISDMDAPDDDTIWFIASGKGIGCYDILSGTYTIFEIGRDTGMLRHPIRPVTYFEKRNETEYFIGTRKQLPGIFNIQTRQYSFPATISKDLSQLDIQAIVADSAGNCWCLIFGQLYYSSSLENKFRVKTIDVGLARNSSFPIFKTVIWDERERVYYAAFDNSNAVYMLDKDLELIRAIPFQQKNKTTITDIGLDSQGRLWISSDELCVYDRRRKKLVPVNTLYPRLRFPSMQMQNLVFRENYLYTVPYDSDQPLIYKLDLAALKWNSIALPEKMLNKKGWNKLGCLEIDQKSNYAYLANRNALYQIDLKTYGTRLIQGLAFPSTPVALYSNFHWYELDDSDHVWVSSNGNIRIYEPVTLQVLQKIEKDPDLYLLQSNNLDGHGIMGFANSGGLELFDYRNKRNFRFSRSDNLITNINSGIACANGILFTGAELNVLQYRSIQSIIKPQPPRTCYLSGIRLFNTPYPTDTLPEYLQFLKLPYDKNSITLTFSSTEFQHPERLEYRYRLEGIDEQWVYTNYLNRTISYPNLKPGTYTFYVSIRNIDGSWSAGKKNLHIDIIPAWWQTFTFRILAFISIAALAAWLISRRIQFIRKKEQQKAKNEKEMMELEARALRAQMNPHFIFNCLNSIKALMQEKETEKGVTYLTTFSKLIRTLFHNADKKEITLYDEIETCKLYLQLEAMRFNSKLSYAVNIDKGIDLKSINIPALIIQPLIENAIWHGIVPREKRGLVSLTVSRCNGAIKIIVEDDGIGREASQQNKPITNVTHHSKGVSLTQSRLDLDNLLKHRTANLEMVDKKDESGKGAGTIAILILAEES